MTESYVAGTAAAVVVFISKKPLGPTTSETWSAASGRRSRSRQPGGRPLLGDALGRAKTPDAGDSLQA